MAEESKKLLPLLPPQRITLGMVPQYVRCKHFFGISRQTAYNWARSGIRGTKLRTVGLAHHMLTTKGWVDDFLAQCGGGGVAR